MIYGVGTEMHTILVLPAYLKSVEPEAFRGIAAETVYIPASVEHIGSKAFADCPNLKKIVFVNGNIDVAEDFVSGCSLYLVIEAPEGSTVASNMELYFNYICPPEPVVDPRPDISVEDVPPGAGDEEGGFAGFE